MGLGYPHRMYIGPSLATGLNTTRFEAQHAEHISRREGQVIKQRYSTFLYLHDRGESSCYTFHVTNQKTHLLISRSDLLLPHPVGDIRDGRDCPIGIHSLHSSSQLSSAPLQPTNTKRSTSNWTQGTTCLNQYKSLCLVCYPSDSSYESSCQVPSKVILQTMHVRLRVWHFALFPERSQLTTKNIPCIDTHKYLKPPHKI